MKTIDGKNITDCDINKKNDFGREDFWFLEANGVIARRTVGGFKYLVRKLLETVDLPSDRGSGELLIMYKNDSGKIKVYPKRFPRKMHAQAKVLAEQIALTRHWVCLVDENPAAPITEEITTEDEEVTLEDSPEEYSRVRLERHKELSNSQKFLSKNASLADL